MATSPQEEEVIVHEIDPREHVNIVFLGHVDSGKSTTSGQVLVQAGQVDKRSLEKLEKDAKDKGRDSWYLAYIMDCSEEEREKGKTVQVARAHFETTKKRYTILDAPGHKAYVPNMISATAQADVAILIISAKKGEFESGFEKGGQTREHTLLSKTLGVKRLIVAVNKMDEPTVCWSKERFDEIKKRLGAFLKVVGWKPEKTQWIPIGGLPGMNIYKPLTEAECPWHNESIGGKSLIQALDDLDSLKKKRITNAPLRLPIIDKFKDHGFLAVLGRVEQGTIRVGEKITVMPQGVVAEVTKLILQHNEEVSQEIVGPGENVQVTLKVTDESLVSAGNVICPAPDCDNADYKKWCEEHNSTMLCPIVQEFIGQLIVLDKNMFTKGYQAMMHLHTDVEPFSIKDLLSKIDKKTNQPKPEKPTFGKTGDCLTSLICLEKPVCLEKFEISPRLGRFTIREETTVMVGKILKIKPLKLPQFTYL